MSHSVLPVTRSPGLDPLVNALSSAAEAQLVLRVTVGTKADSEAIHHHRPVVGLPVRAPEIADTDPGAVDLTTVCTELTRSVGSDDLVGAMAVVATVAGCPTVLLRPDRSVLAAGEPRASGTVGVTTLQSRTWRWTANGPQTDRELAICAGSRRIGVLVFRRQLPGHGLDAPVWKVVHDLLALALLNRDANSRAADAEQQAALFACLSDEYPPRQHAGGHEQVRYRPAVLSPVACPGSSTAELFTRLKQRISEEPLLAGGQWAHLNDRAVCLYTEPEDTGPRAHAQAWQRVLDGMTPMRCRVVVGMPDARGSGLRDSYRTTRWLADQQAAPGPGLCLGDVALVDELGVVAGALGPGGGCRLGHFVRRVLGDLVENPRFGGGMVDTLHAYLVCRGSPTEAAGLLHLSPSSMKYRMRVIRETLGDRLDNHDTVFEIELALRLLKAFEAHPTDLDAAVPAVDPPG